ASDFSIYFGNKKIILAKFPIRTLLLDRLARTFPRLFWQRYSALARRQGFDRLYFILSFDCDTSQDAEAAAIIHERLIKLGIKATYAVPGRQLEENSAIYQSLAAKGATFINHGARPHTIWQDDHYQSSAFYNLMTTAEVVEDIHKGHEIVTRVIGTPPQGFRGPHFGRFQRPEDLNLIYSTIKKMGYSFATTTIPEFGFRHGPAWKVSGIVEFPLSGSSKAPISLLDSYTYIHNPKDRTVTDEYGKLFQSTIITLMDWNICGLLNIYVDPSHVVQIDGFYDGLKLISDLQIPSMQYEDIISMLNIQTNTNTCFGQA
ncbi:MAG: polysaccharide deacetylase family protein, partial [Leptolinea sp.]